MISSDVHKTSRNLCKKKKKCAWLHLYTPSSPISHVQWPPTTSLEQFLRAIVLIYPQIKLNSQLWYCAFFFLKLTVPLGLGPLLTNSPLSWHNENAACNLVSQNPSVFGHQSQASAAPSSWWRPESISSLATRPSSQNKEQNERKISSGFYRGDPQPSLSK